MRTNIEIDSDLIEEALKVSGLATKREAVEAGLRPLVRIKRQEQIRDFRGKLCWEDDLEGTRGDAEK